MNFGSELLRKYRIDLMRTADEESKGLVKILKDAERRMIRGIAKSGDKTVARLEANRMGDAVNRIILESRRDTARWLEGVAPVAGKSGLAAQAGYIKSQFGVGAWDQVPVTRIREAFSVWERSIASKQLLKIDSPKVFEKWAGEWNDQMAATAKGLQREFTVAIVKGASWLDLANTISPDLETLNLAGRMNADAFARGFTRAKLTEISNEVSTRAATDAGINLFVNLGIDDDRQSEECASATALGAMTLEEWDASDEGPPPRHVFNCRCQLIADLSEALAGLKMAA